MLRITLKTLTLGVALATLAAPALADDFPARKPGLWEVTIQSDRAGKAGQVTKHCVDEQTDLKMQKMGQSMPGTTCSRDAWRREGDRIVADTVCKMAGTTITSHAVTTGDFKSAIHTEVDAKYEPPLMGMAGGRTVVDARWTGACPAGWKPGDMEMPGMGRMNVETLLGGGGMMPGKGTGPKK
mgnify:CR=1 FL=1